MVKACIILKVKSDSDPNKVAGAIAGQFREDGIVAVQTIGAGALNQAMKAVAIATTFLEAGGIQLCARHTFVDLEVDEAERTGIRTILEHRVEDPKMPIPEAQFITQDEELSPLAGHRPVFLRPKGSGQRPPQR